MYSRHMGGTAFQKSPVGSLLMISLVRIP
ncbi:hypothetical protein ACLB1S_02470 [Escherichia coli]